jgi:hypothetical protein
MSDSGSHFESANPSIAPKQQLGQKVDQGVKTAGTALGRLAASVVKPAADAAARQYVKGKNFTPEAVKQQTFGSVAKRGAANFLGKFPGTDALSTSLTGMTPQQAATETESLQKLLIFVNDTK